MDKEFELWKKAGKIAGEARDYGKTLLKEGANFLEVSNKIEEFIDKKGGKIGFPVQMSVNNIAAHYTALPEDKTILKAGDIIKLDLGAQVEGYIVDTALTVEIKTKNNQEIIE